MWRISTTGFCIVKLTVLCLQGMDKMSFMCFNVCLHLHDLRLLFYQLDTFACLCYLVCFHAICATASSLLSTNIMCDENKMYCNPNTTEKGHLELQNAV